MNTWCKYHSNVPYLIALKGDTLHTVASGHPVPSMNGQVSEYELQRQKNIAENKKILASLGLDKFKVSAPAVTQ